MSNTPMDVPGALLAMWRKKAVNVQQALQLVQQIEGIIQTTCDDALPSVQELWKVLLVEQQQINDHEQAALKAEVNRFAHYTKPTANGTNG